MLSNVVHLQKFLTGIMSNVPFGIITFSEDYEVGIINENAVNSLGFEDSTPKDLVDKNYKDVFCNIDELLSTYTSFIKSHNKLDFNLSNIKFKEYVLNIKVRPMLDGSLVIIEDISKDIQLQMEATHDNLTKLWNKKEFEKSVSRAVEKSLEHKLAGAVMFLDLDKFKPVNDTAGHEAGDILLNSIANILKSHTRSRDIVARIGGDEFAILLEECSLHKAKKIAENIRSEIEKFHFIYKQYTFNISASIGISLISDKHNKCNEIINAADNACNIAKSQGRNKIYIADENKDEYSKDVKELNLIAQLEEALSTNGFVLHMQEIRSFSKTQQKYYEILIRMKLPDNSLMQPNAFIPSAERYEIMTRIDRWVIENTFRIIDKNDRYSINLSMQSVQDENFPDFIKARKNTYGINPENITFEVPQTIAIQNIDATIKFIDKIKVAGFKFSLDDFCRGIASFEYLRNMSIDYIKINGTFVKEIATDKVSYEIVKSVHKIAKVMGIETIAEYIENQEVLNKAQEIGINFGQGYHIHKPESF
ncbi:EAL domain-containing protein [Thiomicrorhabdus sp. Milos-T2]|uniref:sensor domain-containing protein n=1 Tax=Thiomicrorhabdus sp. Milos-T2 TaxID=90814 RepID=UPI00068B2FF4|nr:EAL domain-containing protein [Thiomicrorhabdus sp. Milos-T2]